MRTSGRNVMWAAIVAVATGSLLHPFPRAQRLTGYISLDAAKTP